MLKQYKETWEKISNNIKKAFDSEPAKMKMSKNSKKSNKEKIDATFYSNITPKEGSQFNCVSVILIDFVFGIGKNYYSQVFLEKYKHVSKEKNA